ncbi:YhcN/YlaJ family sporulation lipoprotein [Paenibacillus sp. MAHUQ-46]|uniref:YhcN/YlaJ family sporulation lipoprotein n=2 Tax=Paenibacillus TaxID=44249 RepID=A0A934J7P0_9BACL|nr:YhcN/YlaJ family sporulation lipoprotein [Paenibacillus roseus]
MGANMLKRSLLAAALCLLVAGCGNGTRNEVSPSPQNNSGVRAQQTQPHGLTGADKNGQVIAHLEALAESVPGVNRAHCVIMGNRAVVGIDVDEHLERSRVGTIKYSVAEAFRKDPYGIHALVTADMDLSGRLKEIGADVRRGRPISGFAEEMADIIGRIVPQTPRNTVPPEDVNTPKLHKKM